VVEVGDVVGMQKVSLGLVSAGGGDFTYLITQLEDVTAGLDSGKTLDRLLWTADGSELWFPHWQAALAVPADLAGAVAAGEGAAAVNLPLWPLVAQPYGDNYGLQTMVLIGQHSLQTAVFRYGTLSLDRRRAALLMANPDGTLASLAVRERENPDENRWIRSYGQLGKVSWTEEGENLLAGQYANQPGALLRIDAANGAPVEIGQGYWLLGTLSELRQTALQQAPQALRTRVGAVEPGQASVSVENPSLGIRLEAPASWQVWSVSVGSATGAVTLTNFTFGDPWGFVSLGEDDLLIGVTRAGSPGTDLATMLAEQVQADPTGMSVTATQEDGRAVYLATSRQLDGQTLEVAYIEDDDGPIGMGYLPAGTRQRAAFETILGQLTLLDGVISATPTGAIE